MTRVCLFKTLMESEMEHGWQVRVESTTLRIWDTGWVLQFCH